MLFDKMKTDIMRFTWKATQDFGVADTSLIIHMPIWGSDYVIGIYGRVVTAFAGITGPVTMKIGFPDQTEALLNETDLSSVDEFLGPNNLDGFFCPKRKSIYNAPSPIITFTSSSGNLEDLTAGQVEIVVVHLVVDK